MIGLLGAKIWIENRVDFGNPVNLVPVAAGIVLAVGNTRLDITDDVELSGIALGTVVTMSATTWPAGSPRGTCAATRASGPPWGWTSRTCPTDVVRTPCLGETPLRRSRVPGRRRTGRRLGGPPPGVVLSRRSGCVLCRWGRR